MIIPKEERFFPQHLKKVTLMDKLQFQINLKITKQGKS